MFKKLFCLLIYSLVRFCISLRYRLQVEGKEELNKLKGQGGMLFLPNHPAELDPVMLLLVLQKFHPRPLVVDHFFLFKGSPFFYEFGRSFASAKFERVRE